MLTDAELEAQIAKLDTAIHRHKAKSAPAPPVGRPDSFSRGGRGRGRGGFYRTSGRQSAVVAPSRNKKLVLNAPVPATTAAVDARTPSTASAPPSASTSAVTSPSLPIQTLPAVDGAPAQPVASTSTSADMTGWIKTSDRHLSLMNPSTFAKRSSARLAGPSGGHLVGAKQLTKEELEGKKIRLGNMSLVLNGVQAARSSKRKAGASTPRKTGKKKVRKSVALPCRYFTKTGRCNKALSCPYVHDPSKLSICQSFLRGSCANSASACPLSHEPSAHNTPSCSHFASSGVCRAGDACLYPHVRTAEDAPLCADFGRYGWCDKGAACEERHAWECKEFAERGTCRMDGKCGLRHVLKSQAGRTMSPPADGPAFFIDSTGDRPVDEDGGLDRPPRRHGPKVDSSALIANQDDFIQLDFDTDSDEDMEDDDDNSGSEDDEEDGESNEEGNEDIDDEAEVADAVALLVDGDDENPASDADDDDPRPRR